jgi:hypothetical protein
MNTAGRFVVAVSAGAVAAFIWGAVSHMTLLKGAGFSHLANDEAVAAELSRSIPHDGLYFLPSPDFSGNTTGAENAAFEARFRAGPTGMILFRRSGSEPVTPRKLLIQFLSELLAGTIGALVLQRSPGPYWLRMLTMGLLGAFGVLSIGTIYWNWYGFPDAFFVAQLVDKVVGWMLAGAVMAAIVPATRRHIPSSSQKTSGT